MNIVKITLENEAQKFLNKNQCKDIIVYLNRPSQLRTMKIDEMFNQYSWSYTLLQHYERHPALLNVEYWEIKIPSLSRNIYIMKKINPNSSITRIGMICILAGELWYLRQIMLKCPTTSWKDAKSHNEIVYTSFQEAAVARGLVVDKRKKKKLRSKKWYHFLHHLSYVVSL